MSTNKLADKVIRDLTAAFNNSPYSQFDNFLNDIGMRSLYAQATVDQNAALKASDKPKGEPSGNVTSLHELLVRARAALETPGDLTQTDIHELVNFAAAAGANSVTALVTHAIAVGNVVDGFKFYGPFDGAEHGVEYGSRVFEGEDWTTIDIQKPL